MSIEKSKSLIIEVNEIGRSPEVVEHPSWPRLSENERRNYSRLEAAYNAYIAARNAYCARRDIRRQLTDCAGEYGIGIEEVTGRVERNDSSNLRPNPLVEYTDLSEIDGLEIPRTLSYDDFLAEPFYPVVVKFWKGRSGLHKYKIENPETFERFKNWMNKFGDKQEWVCQEYIETPSDSYTSYRVLVTCTGDIVTSQIMYGPKKTGDMHVDRTQEKNASDEDPRWLLADPESEFCLNPLVIHSNRLLARTYQKYGGQARIASLAPGAGLLEGEVISEMIGGRIVLDPIARSHGYSDRERAILQAHGLDRRYPKLPKKLRKLSSMIARKLCWDGGKRIKELWLGIDCLQDQKTGKTPLIEANRRPSLAAVKDFNGGVDALTDITALTWLTRKVIVDIAEEAGLERKVS